MTLTLTPRRPLRVYRGQALSGILGLSILAVAAAGTVLAPWIAPGGPDGEDLTRMLQPPSAGAVLGTDELGRDVLTRVLYGGREALFVTVLAVAFGVALGFTLGFASALAGRWADNLIGRLADVQLSIPALLLAMVALAFAGAGTALLVGVLALSAWVLIFRVVRAQARIVSKQLYVDAARIGGAGALQVVRRHILPGTAPLVLVSASSTFSAVLLLESSLGFLGLGVQPPAADWGQMVAEGQAHLTTAWWVSVAPGVALVLVIIGVQLTTDWLAQRWSVAGTAARA